MHAALLPPKKKMVKHISLNSRQDIDDNATHPRVRSMHFLVGTPDALPSNSVSHAGSENNLAIQLSPHEVKSLPHKLKVTREFRCQTV
mmetsp:Transcript_15483/g.24104  ORF Transcript_15483/g.24104 Transcript_15483/m.24104 type:complete len:88 (+) Transcript_15483:1375-1638(+)